MSSEERKVRHTIKNTVRCPYCISVFTMRNECHAHMETAHRATLQEEGVYVASRRMYHIRREGVRILPKKKFNLHVAALPQLPDEAQRKVLQVIRNLLVDSMVLVGNEAKPPASHHMAFKATLNEMK